MPPSCHFGPRFNAKI